MKVLLAAVVAMLSLALLAPSASAKLVNAEVWADGTSLCGRADVENAHHNAGCTMNMFCVVPDDPDYCWWGSGGIGVGVD